MALSSADGGRLRPVALIGNTGSRKHAEVTPGRLPPLVAAGIPRDRDKLKMWDSDTFFGAAPSRAAEQFLALKFQKFYEPRHDFLSFAQPVAEAVETFGGELAVCSRK